MRVVRHGEGWGGMGQGRVVSPPAFWQVRQLVRREVDPGGSHDPSHNGRFTLEEARRALEAVVGKTDGELTSISGSGPEHEPPSLVVSKVWARLYSSTICRNREWGEMCESGSCCSC